MRRVGFSFAQGIPMRASANAVNLIRSFEGLQLKLYDDIAGFLTIGYGHRVAPKDRQKFYTGISAEEAFHILGDDVEVTSFGVERVLGGVSVTQNQFDALVSFAFNCGVAALAASKLLERVRAGDIAGAADQFLRWCHAGSKEVPGLLRRRQAERELFLKP